MSPTIAALVVLAFIVVGIASWWFANRINIPWLAVTYVPPIVGAAIIYWYGTLLGWLFGICLILLGVFVFFFRRNMRPDRDRHEPPG